MHVVLDRRHPFDVAGDVHGLVDVAARGYEATELDRPLERLHVDLG
jgi:hypothetical protein